MVHDHGVVRPLRGKAFERHGPPPLAPPQTRLREPPDVETAMQRFNHFRVRIRRSRETTTGPLPVTRSSSRRLRIQYSCDDGVVAPPLRSARMKWRIQDGVIILGHVAVDPEQNLTSTRRPMESCRAQREDRCELSVPVMGGDMDVSLGIPTCSPAPSSGTKPQHAEKPSKGAEGGTATENPEANPDQCICAGIAQKLATLKST